MGSDFDPYRVLGLDPTASPEEIRRQYRRLALQHHPDKVSPEVREEASARFQEISRAYEILSDVGRRRAWDQTGSTEGIQFDDPMDVFQSMWDVLEESGFLQTMSVPAVPTHGFPPEMEMAFRVFHVMPGAVHVETLPRMEEAVPAWVSQHLPTWGRAESWVHQQGRTLGQWADAFLERARSTAPPARTKTVHKPARTAAAETRRVILRAPAEDVWRGIRRRIRFERRRAGDGELERATCIVPLRLPGVVLEGEGDEGGNLEIRVEATPSPTGKWGWVAPFDLLQVVPVTDVEAIWTSGRTIDVCLPDQRWLSVVIPAGYPTQTWRIQGEGFCHLPNAEVETRGDLHIFLIPGKDMSTEDGHPAGAPCIATPIWPCEGLGWNQKSTAAASDSSKDTL